MTAARSLMRALPAAGRRPLSAVRSAFPPGNRGQSDTRPLWPRRAVMIIIKLQKTNIVIDLTDFSGITGNREFQWVMIPGVRHLGGRLNWAHQAAHS